jgi:hypothetical protein
MTDAPIEPIEPEFRELNDREAKYFALLTEVYEAMRRTVDEESSMPYYKSARANLDLYYRIERAIER